MRISELIQKLRIIEKDLGDLWVEGDGKLRLEDNEINFVFDDPTGEEEDAAKVGLTLVQSGTVLRHAQGAHSIRFEQ
jgi:hypothetical protein